MNKQTLAREILSNWYNNTPHDMGKTEFDKLVAAVDEIIDLTKQEQKEKDDEGH